MEAFSASGRDAEAYLVMQMQTGPLDSPKRVPIILVQQYEDGFTYREWETHLKAGAGLETWTWTWSIGPAKTQGWKPGAHRAMVYDLQGARLAEARWQVHP